MAIGAEELDGYQVDVGSPTCWLQHDADRLIMLSLAPGRHVGHVPGRASSGALGVPGRA